MSKLDDAIEYYSKIAETLRKQVRIEDNDYMDKVDEVYTCEQLAEWLNELKLLRERIDAQPEPQWIPVSKRPPDEGTYVLISKKPSPLLGKNWCVTIAERFVDGRSRKVEWRDIGFGRIYDDDVLAWMPRPEPYRGEKE